MSDFLQNKVRRVAPGDKLSLAGAWFFAVLVLMLTGCTAMRYVPVERVRTEYKDNVREVRTTDSVVDMRYVYVKGDTVLDWRERERWRERVVHDSVYVERTDTIREPYPVERALTRWERAKMDFGGMAMGGFLIAVCAAVVWVVRRFAMRN